jgi:hypothetical protein
MATDSTRENFVLPGALLSTTISSPSHGTFRIAKRQESIGGGEPRGGKRKGQKRRRWGWCGGGGGVAFLVRSIKKERLHNRNL